MKSWRSLQSIQSKKQPWGGGGEEIRGVLDVLEMPPGNVEQETAMGRRYGGGCGVLEVSPGPGRWWRWDIEVVTKSLRCLQPMGSDR